MYSVGAKIVFLIRFLGSTRRSRSDSADQRASLEHHFETQSWQTYSFQLLIVLYHLQSNELQTSTFQDGWKHPAR